MLLLLLGALGLLMSIGEGVIETYPTTLWAALINLVAGASGVLSARRPDGSRIFLSVVGIMYALIGAIELFTLPVVPSAVAVVDSGAGSNGFRLDSLTSMVLLWLGLGMGVAGVMALMNSVQEERDVDT